jgi:quercetin dioxygenase-like cupin family protein
MLVGGEEWTSPDGRSVVRVVELSPERAVIERVLRPPSGKAGAHLHRDWLQSFEAVDGELSIQVGKEEPSLLAVGETAQVPRGVVHVDPWNESASTAVVRNTVSPVTPAVHVIFGTLGELLASGQLDTQDGFTLLQLAAVLRAGRADSWGAQPPIPVQRVVLPVLAAIARARGFRPVPA